MRGRDGRQRAGCNSQQRRPPHHPLIVAFLDNGKGERKVGDPAKRQAITNPKNTISSIKRFMGRNFSEVTAEEARTCLTT